MSLNPIALGFLWIAMLSLSLITLGLATIGAYAMPAVGDHLSKDDRAIFSAGEAVIAEYNGKLSNSKLRSRPRSS